MLVLVHSTNALAMIGLPILLGVLFVKRLKVEWRLFLVGAVTFIASQVLHMPFNSFVLAPSLDRFNLSLAQTGLPFIGAVLAYGLSAGVFEECARYLIYRAWLRKERSWREALMFGLGHGGAEAIIWGGLVAYSLIQAIALRGADLASIVSADRVADVAAQLEMYWNMPWYDALLGAVERVFALAVQISLAVLMLQAFTRKQVRWGVAAVLWHTLIDAGALLAAQYWGIYIAEGFVAAAAIISLVIILILRETPMDRKGSDSNQVDDPPPPAIPLPATEVEDITWEQVEDSRFV